MEEFVVTVLGGIIALIIVYLVRKSKAERREIQAETQRREQRLREIREEEALKRIEEKKRQYAANGLPSLQSDVFHLKEGEILHFKSGADLCKYEKEFVGYSGGGGSVSVPLGKGVRVRTGSYSREKIERTALRRMHGQFFLTDGRLIFSGGDRGGVRNPIPNFLQGVFWAQTLSSARPRTSLYEGAPFPRYHPKTRSCKMQSNFIVSYGVSYAYASYNYNKF